MNFELRADRALARAHASSTRYLMATMTAPVAQTGVARPPLSVALVLDRSGSMQGENAFGLARQAADRALSMLQPGDEFAVVVFDSEVDVLVPLSPATPAALHRARRALDEVGPRGSTALHDGWMAGASELLRSTLGGVRRVLLLTDGRANVGETDPDRIAAAAASMRAEGVITSTLGVSDHFDEVLLRNMAHEGGGGFYFVSSALQLQDYLTGEVGEALSVVLRDVRLAVVLPDGAVASPLNRFRSTAVEGGTELHVHIGDMVSGQHLPLVLAVRLPGGDVGGEAAVEVAVTCDAGAVALAGGTVRWTYASHADNDRQPRDVVVDREVAGLYAARARAEATELNQRGDLSEARHLLNATADRIAGYVGDDPEMQALMTDLRDLSQTYVRRVSEGMSKAAMFASESRSKGRDIMGRLRRDS
jgi:Ca-activated chloride channel homolog